MTAAISLSDIDRVRSEIDIVQVARGVGAILMYSGPATHRGSCPFCYGYAFYANRETLRADCGRCKWTGDCYRLVQEAFGISFEEAFRMLEAWVNARDRSRQDGHA